MRMRAVVTAISIVPAILCAGEHPAVSLRDFSSVEVKSAGFSVSAATTIGIKGLGGGGDYGWTQKSDRMFAYGWIINAETRALVWRMKTSNTSRTDDDREFEGTVELPAGKYEVYFAAHSFAYHTAFSNFVINIDHRSKPPFGSPGTKKPGFFQWFTRWWSDDIAESWAKRSQRWGIDLSEETPGTIESGTFTPPLADPRVFVKATGLGDDANITQAFTLAKTTGLRIRAIGEMSSNDGERSDYGWIVDTETRDRVWEMKRHNTRWAGGAQKNVESDDTLSLPRGTYVVYFVTDDSHSCDDWNDEPPFDPSGWGITVSVRDPADGKQVKLVPYNEFQNVIMALTGIRNNEYRTEGFTLKAETRLRVYALGEQSNSRRQMADHAMIINAKTREKVWTMDVDRTVHAGGVSKNRMIDEIITLPQGSYIVVYTSDDSHAYGDWNMDPPKDKERYGVTIMGVGPQFQIGMVERYKEQRDKSIIAQIVRVGDDADLTERFTLDKTTRVRIYAVGEGQNREMYDYGWVEAARTGNVVWEMTYPMTFHAGGGRKNRMVNMSSMFEKGEYLLRYRSDDSHSSQEWNVDPPDDPQYWGITLYRDDAPAPPTKATRPEVPKTPVPPDEEE